MKPIIPIVLATAILLLVTPSRGETETGPGGEPVIERIEDFFEPLSEHGVWLNLPELGWCWHPSGVADDWRPYTVGHWIETEDGPYWVSDEPWAWACYHYGRWFQDIDRGWLWKPGTEWAPAWVSFRENEDVVGWAPLPPGMDGVPPLEEIYVEEIYIPATSYVFVDAYDFWDPWGFTFFYSYHDHHCHRHSHCTIYSCTHDTIRHHHHRRYHPKDHDGSSSHDAHYDHDNDPAGAGSSADDDAVKKRRRNPRINDNQGFRQTADGVYVRDRAGKRDKSVAHRPDTTSAVLTSSAGRNLSATGNLGPSDRRKVWDRALAVQRTPTRSVDRNRSTTGTSTRLGKQTILPREHLGKIERHRARPSPKPAKQIRSTSSKKSQVRGSAQRPARSAYRSHQATSYRPSSSPSPRTAGIARTHASARASDRGFGAESRPGQRNAYGKSGKRR